MGDLLEKYLNKDVRIIDIDGDEIKGHVETYTPEIDSANEVEEIAVNTSKGLMGITESEIRSIEMQ